MQFDKPFVVASEGAERMTMMAVPVDVVRPLPFPFPQVPRQFAYVCVYGAVMVEQGGGEVDEGTRNAIKDFIASMPDEVIHEIVRGDVPTRQRIFNVYLAELLHLESAISCIA